MSRHEVTFSICSGLIAIASLVVPVSVLAVSPPTPGTVQEPFKPQLELPKGQLPEVEKPAQEEKKPAPPKSEKRIEVRKFKISGNTLFKSEELLDQIRELVGKKLTLEEIYAAADILTDFYRSKGYSLANVVVPAQRVSFGIIELQVIEGRISNIAFAGNKKYTNDFLSGYLSKDKLGKAVSLASLERELLLVNDLPGLTSRAVIRPGKDLGTSEILLTSKEKRYSGHLSYNNYGREEVGRWRLEGEFNFLNPFGIGDQLTLGATKSESDLLDYTNVAYNVPFGSNGDRIGINAAYIQYNVGGDFRVLDIEGTNRNFQVTYSHPIQRSRKRNILVGASVINNISRSKSLDSVTSDSDITYLELNGLFNKVHDDNSVTTASAVFDSNFNNNDGSGSDTGLLAKFTFDVAHLRPLTQQWNLFARAVAVVSLDDLPDTQKFSIGGQGSVRGFPSSEVRGDQGFQTTVEIRRPFIIGESTPATFKAFHDLGQVYRKTTTAGQKDKESLSSVGFGLTVNPAQNVTVDMEYAISTDNHTSSDGNNANRYWMNMSMAF